jgi:hypothetical protein
LGRISFRFGDESKKCPYVLVRRYAYHEKIQNSLQTKELSKIGCKK